MSDISPVFIFDFQRNLNLRFSRAWTRTLKNLWWRSVTITQGSGSLEELYEWMLETAEIRPTGSEGTEIDFEDVVSISHRITNDNFGTGLRLSRNKIEDNRYDKAAQWAAAAANAGAYWPQRQIVKLIQGGKVNKAYDGLPFFAKGHPVNPFDDAAGTYDNLFTGMPLTAQNLAKAAALIQEIPHPGKAPRYLTPTVLLVDGSNKLTASALTGADILTDPLNPALAAPATNMIKRAYDFGQPITVPEFAREPGVWYLGCEADEEAFQGAFIYQERKPFELSSYVGMDQAELDRINEFEWHLRGRNTAAYGHPFLFFRFEP